MTKLHRTLCVAVGVLALASCKARESDVPVAVQTEQSSATTDSSVEPDPAAPQVDEAARAEIIAITEIPDAFVRAKRLGELLPTWGPEQVDTVKPVLEDPLLDLDAATFDLLVRFWALHRPEEASMWAIEKASLLYRTSAVLSAFTEWATLDTDAALHAIDPILAKYNDLDDVLLTALVRGWYAAEGGANGLQAHIAGLPPGLMRQRLLSQTIRLRIRAEGPDAVVAWAESYPADDDNLKHAIYRLMAANLVAHDFEAGMQWCNRHCDGPYGENLRGIIARGWTSTDGAAAIAWVAERPPGRDRNFDLRQTFSRWSNRDTAAAMAWAAAQTATEPPPEWMIPIFPVYARMLAHENPTAALKWAGYLPDDLEREIVTTDVVRIWLEDDPEAAESWLATSPLSDEARARARQPKRPPGVPGG